MVGLWDLGIMFTKSDRFAGETEREVFSLVWNNIYN